MSSRLLMFILLFIAFCMLWAQDMEARQAPDPRPDTETLFYDEDGVYNDSELVTLRRDAELLQRIDIPTLVYVREATPEDASPDVARPFADTIRQDWQGTSPEGTEDGLVMLVSWVPDDPAASTVVLSYGAATFEGSSLSPATIHHTIGTSVASLFEHGHPFEAVLYLMRETRYDGIYTPPLPAPLTGTARAFHNVLPIASPVLAMAAVVALGAISIRARRTPLAERGIRVIVASGLMAATLLWLLSVHAASQAGVVSSLSIAAFVLVAAWVWTRPAFARHAEAAPRTIRVRSTGHRLRRQRPTRAIQSTGTAR